MFLQKPFIIAFLLFLSSCSLTDNLDYHTLEKEFFDEEKFVNLDVYDALSISMGNDHVMPRNERRFYFEPLFKKYYPIYYDGDTNFIQILVF